MGNCSKSKEYDQVIYKTNLTLSIKSASISSKFISSQKTEVITTKPHKEFTDSCDIGGFRLKISGCVLPGQDPKGETAKKCQDNIFIRQKSGFCLATLFDGHGSRGHDVVSHTEVFMRDYFESEEFTSNTAEDFLKDLFHDCEESLKRNSKKINIFGSGTTCVCLLFTSSGIYSASVGDSRAVLATLPQIPKQVPKGLQPGEYRTSFKPLRSLDSIQLTIDQKPNLESELNRIISLGGVVERAVDPDGKPCGPYRVFQKNKPIPGLAMSRSLGDIAAKLAGVIADPIIEYFPLVDFKDQFILIGSDGVWDSISNEEAILFVDAFRNRCRDEVLEHDDELLTPDNCTIARLLAEEARLRWMGMCCEDDIIVDDISVLVLQISNKELTEREGDFTESRNSSKTLGSFVEISNGNYSVHAPSLRSTMTCFDNVEED